ncbi:hypothetical protein KFE25_005807 [Diacronema lutheri]|uniref:Protein HGH1 C-terminal domain-containing protein n=1 Tax=Diacronema lutheri TaxID=2081491 RepID=A0A8J6C1R4_DIALT|nr:hypothetical protein KFE25_005807 [Diacronema lutheri]
MASAGVLQHVRELVEFLASGGQTQCALALEHTAALSGSEEGVAALLEAGAVEHLQTLCFVRAPAARANAAATLANLCAASAPTCQRVAEADGLVARLCDDLAPGATLRDVDVTAEAALLANLSTQPAALSAIAAHAEALTARLLESTDEGTARLAHVLVNAAQSAQCGTRLLRNDGELLLKLVGSQLAHEDGVRRQGAAGVLRNLCLGEYNHAPLCRLPALLPAVCARLLPRNAELDSEDLASMAEPMRAELAAALESALPGTLEPEPSIRLMLTECLLALTATRLGRTALRTAHVYPVLRESHKREEDEAVKAQNEEIVSLILADEGGVASASGAPNEK